MTHRNSPDAATQHTLLQSVLLHIAPGSLATVAFPILKPLADATDFPPLLAFLMAVLLVDIPFMLGATLSSGKGLNGRLSIWQPCGFVIVFVLGAALAYLVWWKQDLRLSVALHVVANTVSRLMFLARRASDVKCAFRE